MNKIRSKNALLRKGFPVVLLWMVFFTHDLQTLSAQGKSAFVVQTLGSLFSIDKGSEDGILSGAYYKLYLYRVSEQQEAQWIPIGSAFTHQVYPYIAVCKLVESSQSYTPSTSDIIALYPDIEPSMQYPAEDDQSRVFVEDLPDEEIKRPLKEPSIQWNLSKKIGSPMGFGIQALYGYPNIPEYINDNLERYISEDIYLAKPVITKNTETTIGQSFVLQKLLPRGFSGRIGYGHMVFRGNIRSELPPDAVLSTPLPDDFVKSWNMSLKTIMHDLSFVLQRGGTQKIKDIMKNKPNSGGFAWHWGFGVNFARIHYETETKTVLERFGQERTINDKEKLPGSWHWGAMGLFGFSHNSGFGTIFVESGFNWWKTAGMNFSYPTRAGIIIYF